MNLTISKTLARPLGLALAILCAICSGPFGRELPRDTVTRFGSLTVNREKTLEFNGRALEPPITGNNSLSLGEPIRLGATDVVLVRDNGGTACPYLYYFVTVSKSGAKATPSFGTCGEITEIKPGAKSISVVMPGYRGPFEPPTGRREAQKQKHTFIFRDGVVKQEGKAN